MRRSNWWILGASLFLATGCGRPDAPATARVNESTKSALQSGVHSGDESAKDSLQAAPLAEENAQGWTAYPPASGGKADSTPEKFSRDKSEATEGKKRNALGDQAARGEPRAEYRNSIEGELPAAGATPGPAVGGMVGGPSAGVGGAGMGGPPATTASVPDGGTINLGGVVRGRAQAGEGRFNDRGGQGEFVPGGEAYEKIAEKNFSRVLEEPLSTFSIDVDTASYANVRRFLTQHALPPPDAVRIEELINYFSYDYAPPADDKPFASSAEVAGCPWNPQHRLVRIGLKGKIVEDDARPVSNLVFLIDVSGSMQGENRLPLVKHALRMLTEKLGENDRVAMVVYAGSSGLVLDSTSGTEKTKILAALDNLQAGGSTNGAGGIQQAYEVAVHNFIKGGVNRVILCTDGDFNVGVTDRSQLVSIIEQNAKTGVHLSVLGFGMGNLKDATMEQLADKGNGNYAYIDSPLEAKKVLVDQMSGTLVTIAKDVKIQVEFNPAKAAAYRLVGYENRMLAAQDFTDDKKDAGEIGAGHTVTALYEVIPAGMNIPGATPELKYQKIAPTTAPASEFSDELLTVKLRYKKPDGDVSTELSFPLKDEGNGFGKASADFRWATSVAAFGMLLRNSDSKGDMTLEAIKEWAQTAVGPDKNGYRREFMHLIDSALSLAGSTHLSDARR